MIGVLDISLTIWRDASDRIVADKLSYILLWLIYHADNVPWCTVTLTVTSTAIYFRVIIAWENRIHLRHDLYEGMAIMTFQLLVLSSKESHIFGLGVCQNWIYVGKHVISNSITWAWGGGIDTIHPYICHIYPAMWININVISATGIISVE